MREKLSVLLATADLVEHSLVEQTLEDSGFHVITARDAASLIQTIEVQRPSAVLLSMDYAGERGGMRLCRHLKANASTRSTPLVLLCHRDEDRFPSTTDAGHPDEVLVRPLFMPEVLFRLRAAHRMQRFSAEINEGSKLDPLTSTFNHSYLLERLRHEVLRAGRYGRSVAFLLIDLDHFGQLNQRHGTTYGDLVLREVARAITSRLRGVDLVARTGADDFSIVLPETSLLVVRPIAERLRLAIESLSQQMQDEEHRQLQISASVGIAGLPHPDARDVPGLLACARAALAQARKTGGNRVVIH